MCIWRSTDKAFPHNKLPSVLKNAIYKHIKREERERERQRKSLLLINLSWIVIALQPKPSLKEKEGE